MKTLFHLYNKAHTCLQAHNCLLNLLNPFVPNTVFLYRLKTLQNRKIFWCFQGVEKGCFGNEWVKMDKLIFFKTQIHNFLQIPIDNYKS